MSVPRSGQSVAGSPPPFEIREASRGRSADLTTWWDMLTDDRRRSLRCCMCGQVPPAERIVSLQTQPDLMLLASLCPYCADSVFGSPAISLELERMIMEAEQRHWRVGVTLDRCFILAYYPIANLAEVRR